MGLNYTPAPGVGSPAYIDLQPGLPNPTHSEGRIFYDDVNKTLAVYNDESDVTLQLGQEIYIRAKNNTAGQIDNGALVFITGAVDGTPIIDLARSDSPSTTGVIAMATHDIGIGNIGFVTVLGSVGSLNTDGIAVGTTLYLSETVAGEWQTFAPTAPNFPIQIGTIIKESLTEGQVLVSIGPTDVAQQMVIEDLVINDDLVVSNKLTLTPSAVTNITAIGGITVTNATMRIQGDGGPVTVTANPQIVAGTDGQIVHITGTNDTNLVTIHDGDGLIIHSNAIVAIGRDDIISFQYVTADSAWVELSTNFKSFDVSWSFSSPTASSGKYYLAGFYHMGSTSFTPAGGTPLGTANAAYGAHAFLVLGATSTDMVVRITGTSIDEDGNRVTSDTQDIDTSGGILNDYFETTKKWIGQISYSLQSGTGVVINNGLCKYWDNQNSDFRVTGLEVTGLCGTGDSGFNLAVIRHGTVGWTFNAGSEPDHPAYIIDLQAIYDTEYQIIGGEQFAWKMIGIGDEVEGGGNEGMILVVITTTGKAVQHLNWTQSIRPS